MCDDRYFYLEGFVLKTELRIGETESRTMTVEEVAADVGAGVQVFIGMGILDMVSLFCTASKIQQRITLMQPANLL